MGIFRGPGRSESGRDGNGHVGVPTAIGAKPFKILGQDRVDQKLLLRPIDVAESVLGEGFARNRKHLAA